MFPVQKIVFPLFGFPRKDGRPTRSAAIRAPLFPLSFLRREEEESKRALFVTFSSPHFLLTIGEEKDDDDKVAMATEEQIEISPRTSEGTLEKKICPPPLLRSPSARSREISGGDNNPPTDRPPHFPPGGVPIRRSMAREEKRA